MMIYRLALAALSVGSVLAWKGAHAAPEPTPLAIAQALDVSSFPNSTGPRRQEGARTLADYGFTEVEVEGDTVSLFEPDRSWVFAVRVIAAEAGTATLCVTDRALNGGSYFTVRPLVVVADETGLLVATGAMPDLPECPRIGGDDD